MRIQQILAVTFTNKAAREMKERLELLLAQKLAQSQYGQPWSTLPPVEQRQLRSRIYREVTKELWIGTFHALFARMLRYDIDKFKDAEPSPGPSSSRSTTKLTLRAWSRRSSPRNCSWIPSGLTPKNPLGD